MCTKMSNISRAFTSLIGELDQFKEQDYGDDERQAEW